jgi:hypothetical protein
MNFDTDAATQADGGGSVRLIGFADLSGTLQRSLRTRYAVGLTSTLTHERTSQIQIPPHKHVRVTLYWKRIWEKGIIELHTKAGPRVELPYAITVGLSFDKTTQDV